MSGNVRYRGKGLPRHLPQPYTGRLSVRDAYPARVALARGKPALVAIAALLGLFACLFAIVRRQRSAAFDLRVTRAMQRPKPCWLDRLLHVVSWPGFPPQSRIIPPTLAVSWLMLGFPIEAVFQVLAWGVGGISSLVKRTMRRPRPTEEQVRVIPARIGGSSFPSGHVIIYTSVYGFLAYLLESLIRPPWLRRLAVGLLGGLLALVGPSRIYLGHHWFTDTVASYLLGAAYLLGLTALYRRVKTAWLNRKITSR